MNKTGLLLVLMILSWITTIAQYQITGQVTDVNTSEKLPGATVRLDKTDFATLTASSGSFQLKMIPPGNYILIVSYVGYKTYKQDISLKNDLKLDIALTPGILLTETAVISATRVPANAPATLTYVGKDELSSRNTGLDLPFILSGIPSAVITSDAGTGIGYTGIRIRGTDMTRINVTVNGIPFNDPESHEVYWVDMPDITASIDNIEIQRGVGTSTNGAASFGGSINIQTNKTRIEPYAEFDASAGSFNSLRTAVSTGTGLIRDKFAFDARLSRIVSDGYIDRASADLKSFFVSGTYLTKKSMVKLNIFSGKEITYQAWDGIPGEILDTNRTFNVNGVYFDSLGHIQYYKNEVDDYQQDNYQLFYETRLTNDLNLTAALHYTHGAGFYEQYNQSADPVSYGLTSPLGNETVSDLITRKWLRNDFYGLTWSLSKTRKDLSFVAGGAWNQYLGDHFGKIIWSSKPFNQQTFDYQWYFNQGDKQDANIYGKVMWSVTKKVGLLADIQGRNIYYKMDGEDDDGRNLTQTHDYLFINPKAGVVYLVNNFSKFHLNAGIAHREPSRTNFKDADKGSVPKAEHLYNLELGYEIKGSHYQAAANIYYMDYKDQLVLTGKINNVGAPVMVNVPSSFREGLELVAEVSPLKWLTWRWNLTLSKNIIRNFTEYVDDWNSGGQIAIQHHNTDLSFSPPAIANSTITIKPLRNLNINLITKYVSKQYIDNTSSDDRKLNPYVVNDIRLGYSIKTLKINEIEFDILLNNIFNELYESNAWVYRYFYEGSFSKMDGYFPQATRNFMCGLKIKF